MDRRLIVAFSVVGLLGAACSHPASSTTNLPDPFPSPLAVNAARAPLLPTNRYALPDFDYAKLQALLAQLKGKAPVVLNLWASDCGPCYREAPELAAAARKFSRRVQFIGVDVQDLLTPARQFIRDHGWSYPSVSDPQESVLNGFGFTGPPDTLFFAKDGHRVSVLIDGQPYSSIPGAIDPRILDQAIRQTLAA